MAIVVRGARSVDRDADEHGLRVAEEGDAACKAEPPSGGAMTADIMCCARCGHALKIVCPEHGTEFVPDRRVEAPVGKTSAVSRGEVIAKPGTLTESVLLALGSAPQTSHDVARVVGRTAHLVGIYLAQLAREGRCERVGHGRYVRAA